MKCIKCDKVAGIKTEDKIFCNSCFSEVIEKRVRKEVRVEGVLDVSADSKVDSFKRIKLLILNDGSEKASLNKYFMKKIINDRKALFKIKKIKKFKFTCNYDLKNDFDKIIIPWCLDDETQRYIKSWFDKPIEKVSDKKLITPLISVTYKDILTFAKINKIRFGSKSVYNDEVFLMINKLNNKYPGTKFSILKTIKNMK